MMNVKEKNSGNDYLPAVLCKLLFR